MPALFVLIPASNFFGLGFSFKGLFAILSPSSGQMWVQGLGWGSGFRVQGLGFRDQGLGIRV